MRLTVIGEVILTGDFNVKWKIDNQEWKSTPTPTHIDYYNLWKSLNNFSKVI